jgi:DNA-binding transcriptional LysR family regulator
MKNGVSFLQKGTAMNWDDFRIFGIAADGASLTAAARSLGVSVATVTRRIAALEADLGLRLFDRSPDGIVLTAHGRAIRAGSRDIAETMAGVSRAAASLRTGGWPDSIRVTATEPVIADVLAPALPLLLAEAPDIRIELSANPAVVSLSARKADVAIRMTRPEARSLVASRIATFQLSLFAAPSYLAGRDPKRIVPGSERLLGYDDSYGPIPEVHWMAEAGLADAVAVRSSSTRALLSAAVAGAGLALLPDFLVKRDSGLVRIPFAVEGPKRSAWLLTHRDLRHAKPVRLVRNWIVAAFRTAQTG